MSGSIKIRFDVDEVSDPDYETSLCRIYLTQRKTAERVIIHVHQRDAAKFEEIKDNGGLAVFTLSEE